MNQETLFEAMADVGDDLLVMAEQKRFTSTWRKWGQMAAMLAVVLCVGAVTLTYLNGVGTKDTAADTAKGVPAENGMMMQADGTGMTTKESAAEPESEAYVEDSAIPAVTAEGVEDYLEEEPEEAPHRMVRTLTRAVCCGTYFYLEPLSEDMGVPPLGEELGQITQAEDPALVGCSVYTMPYSTWFTNYAVDGQPVTQCVYIQTPSGYRYGTTANEKIISRYTMADVQQAIEEENFIWLTNTFVLPIERMGGVQFTGPDELSTAELNAMFWASTSMNTGVNVSDYWMDNEGNYVVPISDVHWRLKRFLDDYSYDPTGLESYDPERDALVYLLDHITYDPMEIAVLGAQVQGEDHLWLLIGLPEQDDLTKEYLIRFDEDSWRYELINTVTSE